MWTHELLANMLYIQKKEKQISNYLPKETLNPYTMQNSKAKPSPAHQMLSGVPIPFENRELFISFNLN